MVRHAQVMESIERLVETMGMGIPQLMRDIDSCIETEDSLSSKQVQVWIRTTKKLSRYMMSSFIRYPSSSNTAAAMLVHSPAWPVSLGRT